jgi:hypothetical protein
MGGMRIDVGGCVWMWVDVDGCGWMWVDVGGCGLWFLTAITNKHFETSTFV